MPFSRQRKGNITATGQHVFLACGGYGGVGIRISGTFSGTLTFEGSVDGASFSTLTLVTFDGSTTATTATSAGQWLGPCAGLTVVRVFGTSVASGNAVISLFCSEPSGARVSSGGGGAGNPSAPSTSVQFNNGGNFGGSANFIWNGTSITIDSLKASTGLANLMFADDVGFLEPMAGIYYDPAYTGPSGLDPPHSELVTTTGITANPVYTHTTTGQQGIYSNVTYTPSGDATSGNMRGIFASVHATGANDVFVLSALDAFTSVDGGQGYTAVIGVTVVATVAAASPIGGSIIGVVASGVQQHASASATNIISLSVDPTNGGSRTLLGTATTLYGQRIVGMTTASMLAPPTNRAALYIGVMGGTATNDYQILSDATQPLRFASAASIQLPSGAFIGPAYTGGSASNSSITIYATVGTGGAGADIIFKGGTNGGTEYGRFPNGGGLVIGSTGLSGTLTLVGSTSGTVTHRASGSAITSYTLTWPTAVAATTGFVLSSTNAGVLSWVAQSGAAASPDTSVQFNSSGSFAGSANFSWNGTSISIASLSASSGLSNVVFADDTGFVEPISTIWYDPAYTGPFSGTAHPSLVLNQGLNVSYTRTVNTGTYPMLYSNVKMVPTNDLGSTVQTTALKAGVNTLDAETHAVGSWEGADIYIAHRGTGSFGTLIGASAWAETTGNSTGTNVIGFIATAAQSGATSVTTLLQSLKADPTDGGSRTLAGGTTDFYGFQISGMSIPGGFTATNRYILKIDAATGTAGTLDYAIACAAATPSYFAGKVGVGLTTAPASTLYVTGTAAGTYTDSGGTVYNAESSGYSALTAKAAHNVAGLIYEVSSNTSSIAAGQYVISAIQGIANILSTDSSSYPATSSLVGGTFSSAYKGSGAMESVIGVAAAAIRNAATTTGAVTNLIGVKSGIYQLENSGTVAVSAAFYAQQPLGTASGTITLQAGLYLESQTPASGTTTTKYGIYQAGVEPNIFGGGIAVGTNSAGGTPTSGFLTINNSSNTNSSTLTPGVPSGDITITLPLVTGKLISASAVTTEVLVSDTSITVNYNGTQYKLLARA